MVLLFFKHISIFYNEYRKLAIFEEALKASDRRED